MNGLERITERIASDAKKENEAALEKARKEADAIIADYKNQAAAQTEDSVPKAKRDAAERTERRLAVAAMEARKLTLAARQNVIQKAFDGAAVRLENLDDGAKVEWLSRVAAKAANTGAEAVILNTAEHSRLGGKVVEAANKLLGDRGNLTLAPDGRDFPGGLVLAARDVELNCTIASLLSSARGELSAEAGKICGVM